MDLEEAEDEERDTMIASTSEHWSEPNTNNGSKVNCVFKKGLMVGKKILVFGFVATSVLIVLPGFVVASAIGLAVSMPCALFLVSHSCTQNLMSKLLPKPSLTHQGKGPLLLEDVCFKQDSDITHLNKEDEAKRDDEMVDVDEENVILDNDYGQGFVNEEFEPELSYSCEANNVIQLNSSEKYSTDSFSEEEDEEEKEEEPSSQKLDDEKPMSGGTIMDVDEGNVILDNDYGQGVVNEEFEPELSYSCDANNVIQLNSSEKDSTDYFSEEEPLPQKFDDEKPMSGGKIMEGFDETEELKEPFEFGVTNVVLEECGDEVKEGDIEEEEMQKETKGLLEKIRDEGRNEMRGEYPKGVTSGTSESPQDIGSVIENVEAGQEDKQDLETEGEMRNQEDSKVCEETVQSRNYDNKDNVCNEVELGESASGNLELEVDGSNDSQQPVTETSELIDGRNFQDEPIGDLMIETQVLNILVAEDLSEVTDDKIDTDENVEEELEPTILQKGELNDNISDLVNQEMQLHEYNKRMDSSDADATEIADESELHLCEENRIDPDAYSYTIDLHEESSSVTVDMHTDSMEVLVSSIELESRSFECSAEKNIVCPSEEVSLDEENIWKQIHVVRKIIGYERTIQTSCADELKALYIFTGVEPPTFVKENPYDPVEINEKLHFLMSIVGIKTSNVP